MSWTDDGTGKPDWDARYNQSDQIWSGDPNGALVTEVADVPPGRALDVGCGEGADAIWLARQGWAVTALDVSEVALGRARKAAADLGVTVTWLHSGLEAADVAAGSFDLVSAQYPALLKTDNRDAERALLGAVAPGGTLLVVHHAEFNSEEAKARGFDPADYLSPADIAAALSDDWTIQTQEVRDRTIAGGSGAHHSRDEVLRAQRN
jgi:SAM-dependent methyltransferase